MEAYRLTATQALSRFKQGLLTVENYARSLLSRIEDRDPEVQAWAYLEPEHVIEQAKKLDQVPADKRGALHGVAIAVKDIIYTRGAYYIRQLATMEQLGLTLEKTCPLNSIPRYMRDILQLSTLHV